MAFWGKQGREPLRQNRWFLNFGIELDTFSFALKECKKPEYEIGVTEHRLLTDTFRYPTLLKWKPITVKMVSTISDKRTLDNLLQEIISQSGYKIDLEQGINNLSLETNQRITKINSTMSIGYILHLVQIDEEGLEIEKWYLNNPFISSVNYGTLTYENDGFVDINLTIQYDWAKQEDNAKLAV